MSSRRIAPLLLLLACGGAEDPVDTDAAEDTDTDTDTDPTGSDTDDTGPTVDTDEPVVDAVDCGPATGVTTVDLGGGVYRTVVSSPDASIWTCISLPGGGVATTEGDWTLAISTWNVKVNGGTSGTGGVEAAALTGATFGALGAAPADGYVTDTADALAFEDWFDYDFTTHQVTPKELVYVVRLPTGAHYELEMLTYYEDGDTSKPHAPTFRWAALPAE